MDSRQGLCDKYVEPYGSFQVEPRRASHLAVGFVFSHLVAKLVRSMASLGHRAGVSVRGLHAGYFRRSASRAALA